MAACHCDTLQAVDTMSRTYRLELTQGIVVLDLLKQLELGTESGLLES